MSKPCRMAASLLVFVAGIPPLVSMAASPRGGEPAWTAPTR